MHYGSNFILTKNIVWFLYGNFLKFIYYKSLRQAGDIMKSKVTKGIEVRKMLGVAVLGLLVLGGFVVLANQSPHTYTNATDGLPIASTAVNGQNTSMEVKLNTHLPIHIIEDYGFNLPGNGVTGGNGTADDPYIIENWEIDGNGGTYRIWIENTRSVYFVIRNCKLLNANGTNLDFPFGSGITLSNVSLGVLENNTCSNNSNGIYLVNSTNNIVKNNDLSSNLDGIMLVSSSNYNNITNNNCWGNNESIHIYQSGYNNVSYNKCTGNSMDGIYLGATATHNNITNNNCSGNIYGIQLDASRYNNISDNNCSGNNYGIYLEGWFSDHYYNNITNNRGWSNTYGIFLDHSAGNNISYNYFTSNIINSKGILLNDSSDNNAIAYNNFIGNSLGIYLNSSSTNNITSNNCSKNYFGILLASSSQLNNITYNYIYNNVETGIDVLSSSSGNIIHHNNFWRNNGAGRGVSGKYQAYDDAGGNTWYDYTTQEGNYWSNWDGNGWGTASAYPIGGGKASDYNPLSKPALPPLQIIGNANLSYYATLYGWAGDGTSGNPYRINGYYLNGNATGTPSASGIWVENTTAWFTVSNCTIRNVTKSTPFPFGAGICIRNVTNSSIEYNTVSANRCGIYLYASSKNTIASNNCSKNYFGIQSVLLSQFNNITYNYIYNNAGTGIDVRSFSSGNIIHHNNFYQNNGAGRGVSGYCQAYDDAGGNTWYDNTAKEGNYWSNWDGNGSGTANAYPIDGGKASDWYPLSKPALPPLHIIGNANLSYYASFYGWAGDGTSGNPYRINGYHLNANVSGTPSAFSVWVENTTAWFTVSNCTIRNATKSTPFPSGAGICFRNVTNGSIEYNTVSANRYGIYLYASNKNTITNNNCYDNTYNGIYVYSASSNNTITNNDCSGNWYGINIDSSSNNTITDNNCHDNSLYGIYLSSSSKYNNITNNKCSNNSDSGIFLYSSSSNILSNNNCSDNKNTGIYIYSSSDYNRITNNTCNRNTNYGIFLRGSISNNITNNNCSANSYYGIYLASSNNNTITYNYFYQNANYGINISDSSTGNILHHNYFYQNNGAGKGVNGNCQAYDDAGGNYWYDNTAQEGNYWSNWDGSGWGTPGAYPIDGTAGAYDMYPLGNPTPELSPLAVIVVAFALLGIIGIRRHK